MEECRVVPHEHRTDSVSVSSMKESEPSPDLSSGSQLTPASSIEGAMPAKTPRLKEVWEVYIQAVKNLSEHTSLPPISACFQNVLSNNSSKNSQTENQSVPADRKSSHSSQSTDRNSMEISSGKKRMSKRKLQEQDSKDADYETEEEISEEKEEKVRKLRKKFRYCPVSGCADRQAQNQVDSDSDDDDIGNLLKIMNIDEENVTTGFHLCLLILSILRELCVCDLTENENGKFISPSSLPELLQCLNIVDDMDETEGHAEWEKEAKWLEKFSPAVRTYCADTMNRIILEQFSGKAMLMSCEGHQIHCLSALPFLLQANCVTKVFLSKKGVRKLCELLEDDVLRAPVLRIFEALVIIDEYQFRDSQLALQSDCPCPYKGGRVIDAFISELSKLSFSDAEMYVDDSETPLKSRIRRDSVVLSKFSLVVLVDLWSTCAKLCLHSNVFVAQFKKSQSPSKTEGLLIETLDIIMSPDLIGQLKSHGSIEAEDSGMEGDTTGDVEKDQQANFSMRVALLESLMAVIGAVARTREVDYPYMMVWHKVKERFSQPLRLQSTKLKTILDAFLTAAMPQYKPLLEYSFSKNIALVYTGDDDIYDEDEVRHLLQSGSDEDASVQTDLGYDADSEDTHVGDSEKERRLQCLARCGGQQRMYFPGNMSMLTDCLLLLHRGCDWEGVVSSVLNRLLQCVQMDSQLAKTLCQQEKLLPIFLTIVQKAEVKSQHSVTFPARAQATKKDPHEDLLESGAQEAIMLSPLIKTMKNVFLIATPHADGAGEVSSLEQEVWSQCAIKCNLHESLSWPPFQTGFTLALWLCMDNKGYTHCGPRVPLYDLDIGGLKMCGSEVKVSSEHMSGLTSECSDMGLVVKESKLSGVISPGKWQHVVISYIEELDGSTLTGKDDALFSPYLTKNVVVHSGIQVDTLVGHRSHSLNKLRVMQKPTQLPSNSLYAPDDLLTQQAKVITPVCQGHLSNNSCTDLEKAIEGSGGMAAILFLVAKVFERCPESMPFDEAQQVQSLALKVLLTTVHHSSRLQGRYTSIGGHELLVKILTSSRSVPGVQTLKVLMDAATTESIFKCQPNSTQLALKHKTDTVIRDISIIEHLVLDWHIWERCLPGVIELLFAGIAMLVVEEHPYHAYNIKQYHAINIVGKIFKIYQERIQEGFPALPIAVSQSVITIVQNLSGSPPDFHLIQEICHFLLLVHPAANTYISHSRSAFYMCLPWAQAVSPLTKLRMGPEMQKEQVIKKNLSDNFIQEVQGSGLRYPDLEISYRAASPKIKNPKKSDSTSIMDPLTSGIQMKDSKPGKETTEGSDKADQGDEKETQNDNSSVAVLEMDKLGATENKTSIIKAENIQQTFDQDKTNNAALTVDPDIEKDDTEEEDSENTKLDSEKLRLDSKKLKLETDKLEIHNVASAESLKLSPLIPENFESLYKRNESGEDENNVSIVLEEGDDDGEEDVNEALADQGDDSPEESGYSEDTASRDNLSLNFDEENTEIVRQEEGLIALCVELLRHLGSLIQIMPDVLVEKTFHRCTDVEGADESDILFEDLQIFFRILALREFSASGDEHYRQFEDIIYLLQDIENTEALLNGVESRGTRMVRHVQYVILVAILELVERASEEASQTFSIFTKSTSAPRLTSSISTNYGSRPIVPPHRTLTSSPHNFSVSGSFGKFPFRKRSSGYYVKTDAPFGMENLGTSGSGAESDSSQDSLHSGSVHKVNVPVRKHGYGRTLSLEMSLGKSPKNQRVFTLSFLTGEQRGMEILNLIIQYQDLGNDLGYHIHDLIRNCRANLSSQQIEDGSRLINHLTSARSSETVDPPLIYLFEDDHQVSDSAALIYQIHRNKKIRFTSTCRAVSPVGESKGELLIGEDSVFFVADEAISDANYTQVLLGNKDQLSMTWPFEDILEVQKRWYELTDTGIEIFLTNGKTCLLALRSSRERDELFQRLLMLELPNRRSPMNIMDALDSWENRSSTNFEYLTELNKLAGRSFNDLMQYPIMPFILKDYTSPSIDLRDISVYRDLSKPVSVQDPKNEQKFKMNYEILKGEFDRFGQEGMTGLRVAPYHYGSHYSNSGSVLHFLVRLPPFTKMFLGFQDQSFDIPDRTFHNMHTSWRLSSAESNTDVKELIPEFFFFHEFLINSEEFDFGSRQNGEAVNNVVLPPWCGNNARLFTLIHRQALESEHVMEHICGWIDLVLGYKQTGDAAVRAVNVFHPATYFGLDVSSVKNTLDRKAIQTMVRTYGQTPKQLFKLPHPRPKVDLNRLERQKEGFKMKTVQVAGLKWGTYLGSPDCPEPVSTWDQIYDSPVGSLIALPGTPGDVVFGISPQSCLLVQQSQDKNGVVVSETKTDVTWAAILTWSRQDGLVRIIKDSSRAAINCIMYNQSDEESELQVFGHPRCLYGHTDRVTSLVVCRPYSVLVSCSQDGTCIIWDLNRLSYVRSIRSHKSAVKALAISNTLGDIASVSSQGMGSQLFLHTINAEEVAMVTCEDTINCLAYSGAPEGTSINVVAGGLSSGLIRLWSSWDLTPVRDLCHKQLSGEIISLTFTTDSQKLYASSTDGRGGNVIFKVFPNAVLPETKDFSLSLGRKCHFQSI
ncbi:LYST-like protein [Mya arenaria]|uniref:LYST-like protein n=1 Tax=Mya arenaria TaxID=6604 RepID=A0ABY7EK84_MYAAR|nr:LYST-like protein [Mya arenaria]